MSVKVMGRVWDLELAPNHKLVLLAYADAAEHDGTQSYPGWERLVAMTGYSRSQIERITGELIASGVLIRVRQGRKGRRAEFSISVSQTATLIGSDSVANEPDSVAQLRDTSRPDSRPASSNEDGALLFEAFFEFWTRKPYTSTVALTRSERGRINAAVKEARLARITAEDVKRRGVEYRILWPKLEATPQALLANWSRFEPAPSVEPCGECGDRGVVWSDGDGNRVAWDAVDAEHAVKCPACARRAG